MTSRTESTQIIVRDMLDADLTAVRAIHFDAFSGYMNTRIGKRYVEKFLDWFRRWEDGVAIVAEMDGEVAGYTVGAPVGYAEDMNRNLFGTAAWGILSHPQALLHPGMLKTLFQRLSLLLRRPDPGQIEEELLLPALSLVGIGVSSRAQGRGVGSALMQRFETVARERGMKAMRLSVYADNQSAIATYRKAGWQDRKGRNDDQYYFYKQI